MGLLLQGGESRRQRGGKRDGERILRLTLLQFEGAISFSLGLLFLLFFSISFFLALLFLVLFFSSFLLTFSITLLLSGLFVPTLLFTLFLFLTFLGLLLRVFFPLRFILLLLGSFFRFLSSFFFAALQQISGCDLEQGLLVLLLLDGRALFLASLKK